MSTSPLRLVRSPSRARSSRPTPHGVTLGERFFESGGGRVRSAFGCRDTSCCPTEFLEEHLRPASDAALVAAKLALPDDLKQKADKQAKRLNDLRTTLGPYAKKRRDSSFARHPVTRIARGGMR